MLSSFFASGLGIGDESGSFDVGATEWDWRLQRREEAYIRENATAPLRESSQMPRSLPVASSDGTKAAFSRRDETRRSVERRTGHAADDSYAIPSDELKTLVHEIEAMQVPVEADSGMEPRTLSLDLSSIQTANRAMEKGIFQTRCTDRGETRRREANSTARVYRDLRRYRDGSRLSREADTHDAQHAAISARLYRLCRGVTSLRLTRDRPYMSPDPPADLSLFPALQDLRLKGVPLEYLQGIFALRLQLKFLRIEAAPLASLCALLAPRFSCKTRTDVPLARATSSRSRRQALSTARGNDCRQAEGSNGLDDEDHVIGSPLDSLTNRDNASSGETQGFTLGRGQDKLRFESDENEAAELLARGERRRRRSVRDPNDCETGDANGDNIVAEPSITGESASRSADGDDDGDTLREVSNRGSDDVAAEPLLSEDQGPSVGEEQAVPLAESDMEVQRLRRKEAFRTRQDDMDQGLLEGLELNLGYGTPMLRWSVLEVLSISRCGLRQLDSTLRLLPRVRRLELTHNRLTSLDFLQDCSSLEELDVSFNHIVSLANVYRVLGNVRRLILRGNRVSSSTGLDRVFALEEIDLSQNSIDSLEDVARLSLLPMLRSLHLDGTPLQQREGKAYRTSVLSLLYRGRGDELSRAASEATGLKGALSIFSTDQDPAFTGGDHENVVSLDGSLPSRREIAELTRLRFSTAEKAIIDVSALCLHGGDEICEPEHRPAAFDQSVVGQPLSPSTSSSGSISGYWAPALLEYGSLGSGSSAGASDVCLTNYESRGNTDVLEGTYRRRAGRLSRRRNVGGPSRRRIGQRRGTRAAIIEEPADTLVHPGVSAETDGARKSTFEKITLPIAASSNTSEDGRDDAETQALKAAAHAPDKKLHDRDPEVVPEEAESPVHTTMSVRNEAEGKATEIDDPKNTRPLLSREEDLEGEEEDDEDLEELVMALWSSKHTSVSSPSSGTPSSIRQAPVCDVNDGDLPRAPISTAGTIGKDEAEREAEELAGSRNSSGFDPAVPKGSSIFPDSSKGDAHSSSTSSTASSSLETCVRDTKDSTPQDTPPLDDSIPCSAGIACLGNVCSTEDPSIMKADEFGIEVNEEVRHSIETAEFDVASLAHDGDDTERGSPEFEGSKRKDPEVEDVPDGYRGDAAYERLLIAEHLELYMRQQVFNGRPYVGINPEYTTTPCGVPLSGDERQTPHKVVAVIRETVLPCRSSSPAREKGARVSCQDAHTVDHEHGVDSGLAIHNTTSCRGASDIYPLGGMSHPVHLRRADGTAEGYAMGEATCIVVATETAVFLLDGTCVSNDTLFYKAPRPKVLVYAPLTTLERTTIGFRLQKLELHFVSVGTTSAENRRVFVEAGKDGSLEHEDEGLGDGGRDAMDDLLSVVLLTRDRARTFNLLQTLEPLATKARRSIGLADTSVENRDEESLESIARALPRAAVRPRSHTASRAERGTSTKARQSGGLFSRFARWKQALKSSGDGYAIGMGTKICKDPQMVLRESSNGSLRLPSPVERSRTGSVTDDSDEENDEATRKAVHTTGRDDLGLVDSDGIPVGEGPSTDIGTSVDHGSDHDGVEGGHSTDGQRAVGEHTSGIRIGTIPSAGGRDAPVVLFQLLMQRWELRPWVVVPRTLVATKEQVALMDEDHTRLRSANRMPSIVGVETPPRSRFRGGARSRGWSSSGPSGTRSRSGSSCSLASVASVPVSSSFLGSSSRSSIRTSDGRHTQAMFSFQDLRGFNSRLGPQIDGNSTDAGGDMSCVDVADLSDVLRVRQEKIAPEQVVLEIRGESAFESDRQWRLQCRTRATAETVASALGLLVAERIASLKEGLWWSR